MTPSLRESFESWIVESTFCTKSQLALRGDCQEARYENINVQFRWEIWQASAASMAEQAAKVAQDFSTKPDRNLVPGVPWDDMNVTAQTTAHSTAQSIAYEIRSLKP